MLYGRDAELARVGALLEDAKASRSGALIVRGEPGVGKSALLEDARERASDMHVLTARGVQSELQLPFAGLHQLVRPARHLLGRLPAPQAAALQGALGLAARAGEDRFMISVACLTLLSELAERRPVLCLIDDAQWLDTSSSDALLFVARRLDAEGIVMLFAAREGEAQRFEARGLSELELRGLDRDAAGALIVDGVAGAVAPEVRDLLVEQSGGNALALVELPTALSASQLAGFEPLPDGLPLTRNVEQLFLERVARLPDATQRVLALVAVDDSGRLAPVVLAAEAAGISADALKDAEYAGLVSVQGAKVDVRHPLVRSVIVQRLSSSERRTAHLALADAFDDDLGLDQCAWHLAAAAIGPDAAVAAELENAAERARRRSGHASAAAGLERAAELSVDTVSTGRRLIGAAAAAWNAGQPQRASTLLDRAAPLVTDRRLRADVDHLRGEIQLRCGVLLDSCDILMAGAAEVATLDTRKALEMLLSGIRRDPSEAEALVMTATDELAQSLAELRELARGIHPAVLARGLPSALESLAARSTVPTAVSCDTPEGLSEPVELALYFVACEALANVSKYAAATAASLRLWRTEGGVAIEIADDGAGGADPAVGSGLRGLADRVEALGGLLLVTSPAGAGTVITAELPLGS